MQRDDRAHQLISDADVQREVYREIVKSSIAKKHSRNKAIVLRTMKSLYELSIKNRKKALVHMFSRYAGRCFYAWSDWTYAVGSGLERKRWAGPRRYEVNVYATSVNGTAFLPWSVLWRWFIIHMHCVIM